MALPQRGPLRGHMRRREFIWLFGAGLTWPVAATAQQPVRVYRLGVLLPHPRDVPVNAAFLGEFQRHGFVEGQNLEVEWRAYGLHFDLISQYAAELANARVDVIVTGGEEALRSAQEVTKTIPIVALVDDMLRSGHVNSPARPEGNTTGVSVLAGDLDGKRQDILIEEVPGLDRLAALADVNNAAAKLAAQQEAARAHNVELSIYRIARGEEIAAAIDRAQAWGAKALNIFGGPLLWAN